MKMSRITRWAIGRVVSAAAKVGEFSAHAWDFAQAAVEAAEVKYQERGQGEVKFEYAVAAVLSQVTGLPAPWAWLLVQLAWMVLKK